MSGEYSLSDIASVTNANDGFGGGNGAWWLIVLFLFAMGGRGFGGGSGVQDGYTLASDFGNIERKIDTVNGGLCDGFYAQNTSTLTGFSSLQQSNAVNTANLTSEIVNGFNTQNLTNLQNANAINANISALASSMQTCCCDLKTTMNTNTRDIIDNANANYRALHDEIVQNKIENLKATIDSQAQQINQLNLAQSQYAQNAYLINALKPQPVPAYPVANPNGCGCVCS